MNPTRRQFSLSVLVASLFGIKPAEVDATSVTTTEHKPYGWLVETRWKMYDFQATIQFFPNPIPPSMMRIDLLDCPSLAGQPGVPAEKMPSEEYLRRLIHDFNDPKGKNYKYGNIIKVIPIYGNRLGEPLADPLDNPKKLPVITFKDGKLDQDQVDALLSPIAWKKTDQRDLSAIDLMRVQWTKPSIEKKCKVWLPRSDAIEYQGYRWGEMQLIEVWYANGWRYTNLQFIAETKLEKRSLNAHVQSTPAYLSSHWDNAQA